ncbi:hypothetical protein HDU81_010148 [Chytriomyces hyalinus]|nr:hypothetical protein HDU81_010148 [Chytriomyces hyalinus]
MGCAASSEVDQTAITASSKAIDRDLQLERRRQETEHVIKLLILGSGESGKSTILKQMKIIHGVGFSSQEVVLSRSAILLNMLTSMISLIHAMDTLEIPYGFQVPTLEEAKEAYAQLVAQNEACHSKTAIESSDEHVNDRKLDDTCTAKQDVIACLASKEYRSTTRKSDLSESAKLIIAAGGVEFGFRGGEIGEDVLGAITELWEDSGVQYCYSRRNEFRLLDSCAYWMKHRDRICMESYVPTQEDMLNMRIMTINVTETKFVVRGNKWAVYDVGGQRTERKKWAQHFDDVHAIIYVCPVSGYDQVINEDAKTNQVIESLNLFETTCNHPLFKETDVILFLNKIDILKEKIKTQPVADYFPDFADNQTFENVSNYFIQKFQSLNKYPNEKKIYPHLTWATNTDQIRFVFAAVSAIIMKSSLKEMDMV